jgi:hypothetical protein
MKTRSVLLIVVLLLVGIAGSVIRASASSPATVSKLQEKWFAAGYVFDLADSADHIMILRMLLLRETTPDILAQIEQWELGKLTKEEVRVVLLNYLRAQGNSYSFEVFRMGEWVSNVENSVVDMKRGVDNKNHRLIFESLVKAHVLACQARGFVDFFAGTAPQEVLQALEQIAGKGSNIDIAGLIIGDADTREIVTALLDLVGFCKSIKRGYGLAD